MVVFKAWVGVGGGGVLLGSSLRSWWHGGISLRLCRNNGATKRIFSLQERPLVLLYFIDASPNAIYNPLNELFPEPRVGMKPHELAKPTLLNTRTTALHCTEHNA